MEARPGARIRKPAVVEREDALHVRRSVEIVQGGVGEGVVDADDYRERDDTERRRRPETLTACASGR